MKDPLARLIRLVTNNDAEYMKGRRRLPPPGDYTRRDLDEDLGEVLAKLYILLFGDKDIC